MIGDYEDDTHFCLKCHTTIIGLDNYVTHRKTQCGKSIDLPKSPLPSQLLPHDDSFNLKADDFFSSLELQSSSKKIPQTTTPGKNFTGILTRSKTTAVIQASASTSKEEIPQSKSGKNVWIGGHQLKLGSGDNQSRLIKAVDNLERRKIEPPKIEVFEESDVDTDESDYELDYSDEDHNAPPRNYTGGKWKPSSPVQDWSAPPPTHTGGKWKPQARRSSPPPTHTKGKWKPAYDYPPPPTFTGSKWTQAKAKEYEESKKVKPKPTAPSPTYTKGKWIPQEPKKQQTKITDDSPLRKSSGMVQYWCRACNRRLASKIVYERHLKSELHFKRTYHDREFDDQLNIEVHRNKKKTVATSTITKPTIEQKRNRKKIFTHCEVCKSKVRLNSMGKHLISHYHCRKGDITTPESTKMVLDYIFDIILQSPYQCSMCKFYFNYQSDFLQHWISPSHEAKTNSRPGYFWCSLCKFKNTNNHLMYYHLMSREHKEVVAAVNRSVPIVIKRVNPIQCEECQEGFLLNVSLAKHCNQTGHQSGNLSQYINNFKCDSCQLMFKSNVALNNHKRRTHGLTESFICTPCNQTFKSKEEAKQHRHSKEHRYKLEGDVKERKCDYCQNMFANIPELKEHLKTAHPAFNPTCLRCGMSFVLPQELTVHLRTKSCTYKESDSGNRCDKCPFASNSTSELLYHKVLHTEPISKGVREKRYKCPLCEEMFPRSSLLAHLRVHTKERPFVCEVCKKGFVRKNNWLFHMRNIHEKRAKSRKKEESFLCSTCGASFHKKAILQQHMITHTGKAHKCPKSGCIFTARSVSELKQHFVTHSDVKKYACTECDYRGKSSHQLKRHSTIHSGGVKKYVCDRCSFSARSMSHLKRHKRLHSGAKPYNCPHCTYKCNTLENLRKHVLSTNKHRGKCIYECKLCQLDSSSFQSNFAKEFKAHLITQHPGLFQTGREAASYIAGIYDVRAEDCTEVPTPYSSGTEEDPDDEETMPNKSTSPKIIILQETNDPIVTPSTSKDEEIFPMFIIPKEVDALSETWNVVGSYDVEESGNLVPFNTDNILLQNHF